MSSGCISSRSESASFIHTLPSLPIKSNIMSILYWKMQKQILEKCPLLFKNIRYVGWDIVFIAGWWVFVRCWRNPWVQTWRGFLHTYIYAVFTFAMYLCLALSVFVSLSVLLSLSLSQPNQIVANLWAGICSKIFCQLKGSFSSPLSPSACSCGNLFLLLSSKKINYRLGLDLLYM